MSTKANPIKKFLKAVETMGLDEDASTAARHHSAVNVTEADELLEELRDKKSDVQTDKP